MQGTSIGNGTLSEMSTAPKRTRRGAPPEQGWTLGAGGLPKAFWVAMCVLLIGLAALILFLGYNVYGALVLVLAAAASVNLL